MNQYDLVSSAARKRKKGSRSYCGPNAVLGAPYFSFNSFPQPPGKVRLWFPFYRRRNWGPSKFSKMPKVRELVGDRSCSVFKAGEVYPPGSLPVSLARTVSPDLWYQHWRTLCAWARDEVFPSVKWDGQHLSPWVARKIRGSKDYRSLCPERDANKCSINVSHP